MDDFDAPTVYHHDETMPPIEPGTFGFSRRGFLAGGGALAMSAFLAACGSSSKSATTTTAKPAGTTSPPTTAGSGIPAAGTTSTVASATTTTVATRPEAKTDTITIGAATFQEAYVDPNWATGGLIFPLMWAISDFLYQQNQDGKFVPTSRRATRCRTTS